jgi:hypothetical protein
MLRKKARCRDTVALDYVVYRTDGPNEYAHPWQALTVLEAAPTVAVAIDRESVMKTEIKTFDFKHLIVLTAHGALDLVASKAALKSLVAAPGFEAITEVLLDLRDVECDLSVTDIHELVTHMAWHIPVLFDEHRIAVLIDGHKSGGLAFNHSQFLDLCAKNNGLHIRAYEDYERAINWLTAELTNDSASTTREQWPLSSISGKRSQFGLA